MIVCHCEVVNDRLIRAAIARGASTADDVAARCGAGSRCGSCRPTISALLAATASDQPAQPAA